MTKKFEETRRGSLSSLVSAFEESAARGECTVVIAGA
jgi:16S rRNA C1402 (ribose-2'-O) methylase RsmI